MRQIPLGTKATFTLRVLSEHLASQFKVLDSNQRPAG